MENYEVTIKAPSPRPIFEEEVNLLLEILPPDLIHAIAMLGCDEAEAPALPDQR